MMKLVPNSGIFNDDNLDRLRGDALMASEEGLPEPVVYYPRALESRLLDALIERKKAALRDIGWKHFPTPDAAA